MELSSGWYNRLPSRNPKNFPRMGKILSLYASLPRTYYLTIAVEVSDGGKVAMEKQ